jgi:hypothetical protein
MRVFLGFLLAVVIVAFIAPWAIEGEDASNPLDLAALAIWFIPFVGFFTLITAVPLYFFLRSRNIAKPTNVIAAGFFSAFSSFALFSIPTRVSYGQLGSTILVRDGVRTLDGWIQLLQQSALMGVAGAIGAACFLLVVGTKRGVGRG